MKNFCLEMNIYKENYLSCKNTNFHFNISLTFIKLCYEYKLDSVFIKEEGLVEHFCKWGSYKKQLKLNKLSSKA